MRQTTITMIIGACVLASAAPAAAQGFGLGGRMAWVKSDSEADTDAVRFTGGQIRLVSGRIGLELSMDRRTESFDDLNQKVTETPIQASLMLRSGGRLAPYLLGGPGWYRRKVEPLGDSEDESVSETEFGWHGGIGLEISPSKRFGIHGDYRYTFLDFSDDDEEEDDDDGGFISGLLPKHRGSMWTLGVTIYF